MQFFFERGDGKLIQPDLSHRLVQDQFPTPQFKSKRNRYSKKGELIEPGLVPFQAADVLAYLFRLDAKYYGQDWRDKESIHWMLQELSPIPETPIYLTEHLRGLNVYLRAACINLRKSKGEVSS